MRAVIQRVNHSSVNIGGEIVASINNGLLILLGIEEADGTEDIDWLAGKIIRLRIFPDAKGIMNCSIEEAEGDILVVSQFTLHASTKKGNRPSYIRAARPEVAIPLYNQFVARLESRTGKQVQTGDFGAMMEVSLVNDGPVTIFIDTKNRE
ncbi:MAG: D-tyrosyl-tRNA(Tyr) deacylase [Bacteroidales bacterium]|nr:D-tyrosyl-tRNA(Tyr) deacylase [Bacteroidota bacterium]MBL6950278.1 D-tyrosyl-tRNA(Tyr) deacylase [Bacteroidales bacterium]